MHQAADGPLARVRLPGGRLTGPQLADLASMAVEFGDGHVALTSRANVELRALTRTGPTELAGRLSAAGLLPTPSHETVRNIAAPPLPDARTLALLADLDTALRADPALTALPGRFLFAIGTVPLTPDVAAVPDGDEFAILFAAGDEGLRVPANRVVEALLAAAHEFLAARAHHRDAIAPHPPIAPYGHSRNVAQESATAEPESAAQPERVAQPESAAQPERVAQPESAAQPERVAQPGKLAWRLAELPGGVRLVAARTASRLGLRLRAGVAVVPVFPASPVGVLPQPDGRLAVGAIVPLGRLTGVQLRVLAEADQLVVTPWRGVVVADLAPEAAPAWQRRLAEAGLPSEPDSRWTGVTACAGRPGCAKSLADVRADASATTTFIDGLPVHWLGCDRGCGSPAGAHVRVEATPGGYAVTTPDGAVAYPEAAELAEGVAAARRS
jgi:precorrin-3B synthase